MEQFLKHFGYENIEEVRDVLNDKNLVGVGSSAIAYKIWNKNDNKFYLLKKFNKSKFLENQPENESEILKNISHQNVVKYYYSFLVKESYYIIMEYCENFDLRKFIDKYKEKQILIDEKVILIIILDICCGLKEIHNKNIIHKDLKPENIYIDKDYKIKIGDFSISKKLKGTINTKSGHGIGTLSYMAPEILFGKEGEKYNNKIDIWSFGCIIYELLTLNTCFDSDIGFTLLSKIKNAVYDKSALKKNDNTWENLINLMLQKNPSDRPDIYKVYDIVSSIYEKKFNSFDEISINILKRGIEVKKQIEENKNLNNNRIISINAADKYLGNKIISDLTKMDCKYVKEINLECNIISNLNALEKLNFDILEKLDLSNNRIKDINILSKVKINKLNDFKFKW